MMQSVDLNQCNIDATILSKGGMTLITRVVKDDGKILTLEKEKPGPEMKKGAACLVNVAQGSNKFQLLHAVLGYWMSRSINGVDPASGKPTARVTLDQHVRYDRVNKAFKGVKEDGKVELSLEDWRWLQKTFDKGQAPVNEDTSSVVLELRLMITKAAGGNEGK